MRMLRPAEVYALMGVGRTTFDQKYVKAGRVRWVRDPDGRINRLPDTEVARLQREDIEASEANSDPPKPAVSREGYLRGANARRRRSEARA